MLLVKCTGVQISLNILPTCISIEKSQPNFPNPEETYPGVGLINTPHTHCDAIFCKVFVCGHFRLSDVK